jgi:hypothetical protein
MNSVAYLIAEAIGEQLQQLAAEQGVLHLVNPALPLDLRQVDESRERALFHLQASDRVQAQPGQVRELRRVRVLVGAMAVTADTHRRDADELHFAARLLLRGQAWRQAVRAQLPAGGSLGPCREVEIEGELKSVSAEGSGLISAFEIEYEQPYPAA